MTRAGGVLVVGIGNPDRGDDGIGPVVAREVVRLGLPGVRVAWPIEPVDLLDDPLGVDLVVLVDAVRSGAPTGTVLVRDLGADPLPAWTGRGGTHALGLDAAVELARALDRLPPRLVLVGVEGAAFDQGAPLSPAVAAAVGDAVAAVAEVSRAVR